MQIKIRNIKRPTPIMQSAKIRNNSIKESRGQLAPMWGIVKQCYSEDNTADILLRNGLLLRRVTVPSRNWAGYNNTTPFGSQNLPPKNTEVLLVFPDNLIEEAVIISSRFEILGDIGTEQKKEFLIEGQERIETTITEYGWKIIYDKDLGNWSLQHPSNEDFIVEIDEENKKIKIQDWNGNVITMGTSSVDINGHFEVLQ